VNIKISGVGLTLLLGASFLAMSCGGGGKSTVGPTVISVTPVNGATLVPTNSLITATFNVPLSPDSINSATFSATAPSLGPTLGKTASLVRKASIQHETTVALTGTVTFNGRTATLKLDSLMPQNMVITVTIGTGVKNLANQFLSQPYVWSFTTGTNDVPPTVLSTVPVAGATGVSPSANLSATFNKPMDASSLTPSTFTLKGPNGVALPSTVTYANDVATLNPTSPLTGSTLYTATITTGAKDVAGTFLVSNYTWTFTTASTDVAPTVISTVPTSGATGVSISTKVTATFSEAMNPATINSANFTLTPAGGTAVPATVTYSNNAAVLDPTVALLGSTVYTAVVTTGVTDVAGTPLASKYTWTFTTASTDVAPTVVSTVPASLAAGVSISTKVTATFSEAMNASTINSTNFTLTPAGGAAVSATVTYANDAAVLDPTSALQGSTVYTATVTNSVKDVAGTPMTNNYSWTFTTAAIDIAPTVISTVPVASATHVLANTTVSVTFSEAMNSATINTSTFSLAAPGNSGVTATVSYANDVATLVPTSPLTGGTTYTATVTTGVKDVAGTPLANTYTWSFTTDSPPTVVSNIPLAGAIAVLPNTAVSATFSEAMNPTTISGSTFSLAGPNNVAVAATVTYANNTATLTPSSALTGGTKYTATVTTGVKDVVGTAMVSAFTWSFTTDIPPAVVSTFPANLQTQVGVVDNVTATFNEALNAATVNGSTFKLTAPGNIPVPATVSYATDVATLAPTSALAGSTTYTATVTTGVKDVAGTPMATNYVWTFTTGQAQVNLGTAGTYGVLAGSTVTNTGPTIIKGDLGVSPGTAITGFPPGTFTGVEHAGDAVAAKAKADLLLAYTDITTRLNANALPGDVSGLTFSPGLYSNSTSVMLGVGSNVTFDAKGDPGAIFVLQMGSTLTTGVGSTMTLIGGANAKNIYWGVGSSATLGVNSTAVGNILAQASITANTGTVINGRFLTNVAAVTLASNSVTVPPKLRFKTPPPPPARKKS